MLYNSIAIKKQGFSTIDGRCFSPMTAAMQRARTLSERTKDAVVYDHCVKEHTASAVG